MLLRMVLLTSIGAATPLAARLPASSGPTPPVIWKDVMAVTGVRIEPAADWRLAPVRYDVPVPRGATIKVKGRRVDMRVPF